MNYQDHVILNGEPDFAGGLRGHELVITARTKGQYTIAAFATEIATKFALVAAMPDGEDRSGRQKLRLPTAKELTERACDIASELWAQYESRGWLFDIPLPVKIDKTKTQT